MSGNDLGKSKVISCSKMKPVCGGKEHMFSEQSAGPAIPGQSAAQVGRTAPSGGEWAKGGGTGWVGKQPPGRKVVKGRVSVSGGK